MSNSNTDIKVAKVIDRFHLVLNKGSNDGIDSRDRFLVYVITDEVIKDPETGESLGNLEIVKGTGVITHVQDKIATLESDQESDSSKKIVKRNPLRPFADIEEEIVDSNNTIPFDKPQAGDLVKPI